MKYLVTGFGGPGFESPEEATEVLESIVHPSFDQIQKLEAEGKILVSGLPVGERSIVFVLDVDSNDEADKIIQSMPIWGSMEWQVVALQDTSERFAQEKKMLERFE